MKTFYTVEYCYVSKWETSLRVDTLEKAKEYITITRKFFPGQYRILKVEVIAETMSMRRYMVEGNCVDYKRWEVIGYADTDDVVTNVQDLLSILQSYSLCKNHYEYRYSWATP